jgi:hypothetical protein
MRTTVDILDAMYRGLKTRAASRGKFGQGADRR